MKEALSAEQYYLEWRTSGSPDRLKFRQIGAWEFKFAEDYAALCVSAERERCAKIAEARFKCPGARPSQCTAGQVIAEAIRTAPILAESKKMKKLMTIFGSLLCLLGCHPTAPSPAANPVALTTSGMTIKNVPGDRPKFKRIYHVRINANVTMDVTIYSYFGYSNDLMISGELDQTGGKWVLFDPENPADKILDREILPLVQQQCSVILQIDKQYRDSHPNQFTDEGGQLWRKMPD